MDIAESSLPLVRDALQSALLPHVQPAIIGISCIAAGADTVFAEAVLDLGGQLIVVLPAEDYREQKVREPDRPRFDSLVARAASVRVLPYPRSNRDAYQAANETVLAECDLLFAVWDGRSPVDKGGTAAVVATARSNAIPVTIIWPAGAQRVRAFGDPPPPA
jgi:hypothetical protein